MNSLKHFKEFTPIPFYIALMGETAFLLFVATGAPDAFFEMFQEMHPEMTVVAFSVDRGSSSFSTAIYGHTAT